MKKTSLLIRFVLSVFLALASSIAFASTFEVQVIDDGKERQRGIGTMVSGEMLIVNARFADLGNQIFVTNPDTGSTLLAQLIATDTENHLALIRVPGLEGKPFVFSQNELDIGRTIIIQGSSRTNGLVRTVLEPNDKFPFVRVEHTVGLEAEEIGAPILNNCGELAGISVHNVKSMFDKRLEIAQDFSKTTDLATLLMFLSKNNVSISAAQEVCLSEEDTITLLEEEKQLAAELALKTEEQKKAAEAELERLREEKAAQEKALQEANERLAKEAENKQEENQKEIDRIEAELENARQEQIAQEALLEQAKQAQLDQQKALEKAEQETLAKNKQLAETEAAKLEQEETIMKSWIIASAIIFTLVIIAVGLMTLRRKQLKRLERDALLNQETLIKQQSEIADAEQALQLANAVFNDIVFAGKDEMDGNEYRFKISGKLLARSEDGLLLGRSVQSVDCVLAGPSVSKIHARVSLSDDKLFIQDLGSSNGTAVNNKECADGVKLELKHDDVLRIGRVAGKLIFID